MRIIQISDFHLRGDGKLSFQKADTIAAVDHTIAYMSQLKEYELPEFFVVTGDLADGGTKEGYEIIRTYLQKLPRPVYILPGNHDKREYFLEMFSKEAPAEEEIKPYICYTIDIYDIRVIVVDTSKPGCHSGGLSEPVADWLSRKIVEYPDKPTLVFTHHVPFRTGLPAMDEGFDHAERFAEILRMHKHVKLCCGHMHTMMSTVWNGIPIVIAPPVSMLMEVDFREKDSPYVLPEEKAENFKGGGDRFFLGNPQYLIHHLIDDTIITHCITIPTGADYSGPWSFKYYQGEQH